MKRSITILTALLFTITFLSCGGSKSESTKELKKSREGYEKLIAQFEVPMYEGLEFVELGKIGSASAVIYKTKDSADKVIDFYYNKFKELKLNFITKSPVPLKYQMNGQEIRVIVVQGSGPKRKNNDPLNVVVTTPDSKAPGYQMVAFSVGYGL